jgi:hypothetical protein
MFSHRPLLRLLATTATVALVGTTAALAGSASRPVGRYRLHLEQRGDSVHVVGYTPTGYPSVSKVRATLRLHWTVTTPRRLLYVDGVWKPASHVVAVDTLVWRTPVDSTSCYIGAARLADGRLARWDRMDVRPGSVSERLAPWCRVGGDTVRVGGSEP